MKKNEKNEKKMEKKTRGKLQFSKKMKNCNFPQVFFIFFIFFSFSFYFFSFFYHFSAFLLPVVQKLSEKYKKLQFSSSFFHFFYHFFIIFASSGGIDEK